MVGRKKKLKIVSHEDRLSNLPDYLISDHILSHLSTMDAVRTSVLSTRWKSLWQLVTGLDLDYHSIRNFDAFVSFVERFFDSHKESWIRKLRLCMPHSFQSKSFFIRWIDIVTTHRIQHLDFAGYDPVIPYKIPQSIFTCKTLVHLQLCVATFVNAEFVSLPCLKIMHLTQVTYTNYTTLEKLISGSPILEDLTILLHHVIDKTIVLQVRSQTLKRIHIDQFIRVVIDAPLLQCLRTIVSSTNMFKIINPSFFSKLDIINYSDYSYVTHIKSVLPDILTYISRVKDLVIPNVFWKCISKSGPVLQFRGLSRLNASISKSNLEMLPTILESCPKLESFTLDMVGEPFMRHEKKIEPKVMFSTVPQCLISSLKFVELKRPILGYEGETELVRYLLKNSTLLGKLRLEIYYPEKKKCDFLKEILTMPRCSSACEIHCSFVTKIYWL